MASSIPLILPIDSHREEITQLIRDNVVVIIESFTGSGKTIRVPQYILDSFGPSVRVAVTQPRRIAATSAAGRVAEERRVHVGGNVVGYKIASDSKCRPQTTITYLTTGTLLQILINQKYDTLFTHLILDEVHVRDLNTDLLLLVIKKLSVEDPNWKIKIILLSATIDASIYKTFFSHIKTVDHLKIPVEKRMYNVETFYNHQIQQILGVYGIEPVDLEDLQFSSSNCSKVVKLIQRLDKFDVNNDTKGSVLVFLPGLGEINALHDMLDAKILKKGLLWQVFDMHSNMSDEKQRALFKDVKSKQIRNIILATNIAESSITLPSMRYVVDFCLTKRNVHDIETNLSCLELQLSSQHQCIQRMGRVGRNEDGFCFRLIDETFYETGLSVASLPEITSCGLDLVFLNLKNLNMGTPQSLLQFALKPPDEPNFIACVESLKESGAVSIDLSKGDYDDQDGNVTFIGRISTLLSIDPKLAKLIALGHVFGLMKEAIVIASIMSNKSIFLFPRPHAGNLNAWLSKLKFSGPHLSDSLASLEAYKLFLSSTKANVHELMKENYLKFSNLKNVQFQAQRFERKLNRHFGCTFQRNLKDVAQTPQHLMWFQFLLGGAAYPNIFLKTKVKDQQHYMKQVLNDVAGCDPLRSIYFLPHSSHVQPGEDQMMELKKQIKSISGCMDFPAAKFSTFKRGLIAIEFSKNEETFGSASLFLYSMLRFRVFRKAFKYHHFDSGEIMCAGPSTPLHMSFRSFARSQNENKVIIDRDSVTFVSVDTKFEEPTSYVATALKLSKSKNGMINLKEVNRMEPIQGMFVFLNLLFAPRIQLRGKTTGSGYTSCVAGLGLNPLSKQPIAQNSNIECLFDINITREDILKVNVLRGMMNTLLRPSIFNKEEEDMDEIRDLFLYEMSNFIAYKRGPNLDKSCYVAHEWKQQSEERSDPMLLFPPHKVKPVTK